jgi:release factor glutamine methyltransferase
VTALDGGVDGLDPYRAILARVGAVLAPAGVVVVEIGWTQGPAVAALFERAGLSDIQVTRDLAGRDRVVSGVSSSPRVR